MTSATTQPATGTGGRHAEGHGYGLVLFASILLVVVGCFNLIYGIATIANSHVFTANAHPRTPGRPGQGKEAAVTCHPIPGERSDSAGRATYSRTLR